MREERVCECASVHVCACLRKRKREREKEREKKERERELAHGSFEELLINEASSAPFFPNSH